MNHWQVNHRLLLVWMSVLLQVILYAVRLLRRATGFDSPNHPAGWCPSCTNRLSQIQTVFPSLLSEAREALLIDEMRYKSVWKWSCISSHSKGVAVHTTNYTSLKDRWCNACYWMGGTHCTHYQTSSRFFLPAFLWKTGGYNSISSEQYRKIKDGHEKVGRSFLFLLTSSLWRPQSYGING